MWFRDVEGEPKAKELDAALRSIGVRPGTRIASLVGNTPAAVALHKIMLERGAVVIPIDGRRPDAPERLREAGAMVAVTTTDAQMPVPVVQVDAWGTPLVVPPVCLNRPASSEAGVLVWSSGTTGNAKTVLLTPAMLAAHAAACKDRIHDGADASWLAVLGLQHVGGIALVDRTLRHGAGLVLEEQFDAMRAARLLEQRRVTHVSLVPTQLRRLMDAWGKRPVPRTLACVLVGGDALPEPLALEALEAGWPIHATYGLSEACSQVATATPQQLRAKPQTSGHPLPGVAVAIVNGEVIVAGPTVAGGLVATGDLGHLDADGFLAIEGRRDDRITTGGAKVEPGRVEAVLRGVAGVTDAAVVGAPDLEWGQRVVAVVVGGASDELLRAACKAKLAAHEVPKEFRRVASLPRTQNGKLQRAKVRASL